MLQQTKIHKVIKTGVAAAILFGSASTIAMAQEAASLPGVNVAPYNNQLKDIADHQVKTDVVRQRNDYLKEELERQRLMNQLTVERLKQKELDEAVNAPPQPMLSPAEIQRQIDSRAAAIAEEKVQAYKKATAKPKKKAPVALPVVSGISGVGNNLIATVLVPYRGEMQVKQGDRLPSGHRVSIVTADGVTVEDSEGVKTPLSFGSAVPMAAMRKR